uniref:Uncharacterized protein n=1 Tax=Timema tahoe TaxID=61484 RepID=A0A7R9FM52_9NEOP|nr:unnamed protein product [Timema tahoe]
MPMTVPRKGEFNEEEYSHKDFEISPNALENDEPFLGFKVNDDRMLDIGERQAHQGAASTESNMLAERRPSRPKLIHAGRRGRPTKIYQPAANRADQNLARNNDRPYVDSYSLLNAELSLAAAVGLFSGVVYSSGAFRLQPRLVKLGKPPSMHPDYYLNLDLPIVGGLVYCEIRTSITPSMGIKPTALPIEHYCGQWLPHNKLELLGISLEVDQAKLIESRKPTDRKAVRKAYQEAMVHRCQVAGTPIVGAVTRHGKLTSMFKLPQTFSKDT